MVMVMGIYTVATALPRRICITTPTATVMAMDTTTRTLPTDYPTTAPLLPPTSMQAIEIDIDLKE
jgi:hypothetical protein